MDKKLFSAIKKYRSLATFLAYAVIFLVTFIRIRHGIGMFWDWSWPVFRQDLSTLFVNSSHSWTSQNLGQPISYNPAYYSNWLLSQTSHLGWSAETVMYLLLVVLSSLSAFGVNLIANKKVKTPIAFLIGLLVVANPAYLYKLMAGHLSYLISFPIFIFMIYFLFYSFKNRWKESIILGLFLGFVGTQIQFFIFAMILLLVYYLVNRQTLRLRYLILPLLIALLINLPWLSNFLIGANSVSGISGQAGNIAFGGATFTSLMRVLTLSFSDATLIKYLYPKIAFAFFGLFSVGLLGLTGWKIVQLTNKKQEILRQALIRGGLIPQSRRQDPFGARNKQISNSNKQSSNGLTANCQLPTANSTLPTADCKLLTSSHLREFWVILISLIIFIFLGTGLYQNWNIPIIRTLYPMLRESGHLAPIIVLFMALLLIRLWSEKKWIKWPVVTYLIIFVAVNALTIYKSLPSIDYSRLRTHLAPYKEFLDKDQTLYRISSYPFFGQYSVAWEDSKVVRGQPVRNTGIDVFTQNSDYDALSNYIPAQLLDQSVQWQVIRNLDIAPLEERNIKYLLDFSSIYQSNVEKYSDPSFYDNNLSMIKNNPALFPGLLAMYPDRLREVAPNIYELTKTTPRVDAGDNEISTEKINPSHYVMRIKNAAENFTLRFASNYSPAWKLWLVKDGKKLELDNHQKSDASGQEWNLKINELKDLIGDQDIKADGTIDLGLDLYFQPEKYFQIAQIVSAITIIFCLLQIKRLRKLNG